MQRAPRAAQRLREGGRVTVKLLDLGAAKLRDGARFQTGKGRAVGSPSFMSPEQIRGEPLDGRSDLISLGMVAYTCLAGRSPFEAGRMHLTFRRILEGQFEPVTAVRPELSTDLDGFFARALAVARDDRFQNAAELAAAFRAAIGE